MIAILAIVFAMLLPTMHRPGPASTPSCLSNQKQIAFGLLLYNEDFKTGFPNLDNLTGNDGPIALQTVTNYIKNINNFMCPATISQRRKARSWRQQPFAPVFDATFFRSNGNDYAYYDGVITSAFTNVFLSERLAWTNRLAWKSRPGIIDGPAHANGRVSAAFGDGHAEMLNPNRVVGEKYDPPWSTVQEPLLRP